MGRYERGVRTGTGPYQGSYRRRVERKKVGRRQERGEVCPITGNLGLNDVRVSRQRSLGLKDVKPMGKPKTTILGSIQPFAGKSSMKMGGKVKLT